MDDLLQNQDGRSLNALVDAALHSPSAQNAFLDEAGIEFGPVVTRPEKIVCVGLNYRHHAQEIGVPIPRQPVLFSKFNNALHSHNQPLRLPVEIASKFDYEVELVIVIGYTPARIADLPGTGVVDKIESAPRSQGTTSVYRLGFGLGAIAMVLPMLVLVGTATRLSAAKGDARKVNAGNASMNSTSATP